MTKIFISYRRKDSKPIASMIFKPLAEHFGRDAVFMDIHGIPVGVDFHEYLNQQVSNTKLLLAIIADRWLTDRLDDPNDFVRIEIEAALQRGIPIVPLYVDGAPPFQADDLPNSLEPLARLNGAFLDTGRDFDAHIARLVEDLETRLAPPSARVADVETAQSSPVRRDGNAATQTTLDPLCIFRGQPRAITAIVFSPDSRAVASANIDPYDHQNLRSATIKLWTWAAKSAREIRTLASPASWLSYSRDGKKIYSYFHPTTLMYRRGMHPSAMRNLQAKPALKVWDVENGRHIRTFNGDSIQISPDDRHVVGLEGGHLIVWDSVTGQQLRSLSAATHWPKWLGGAYIHSFSISPDGSSLLCLWSNSEVDIRDISSLESRQTWSVASRSVATSRSISRQTYGDLYSPDGRFAILGHQWWNISEQREIDAVDEHRNVIAFSKDGRNAMSTMPGHPFESLKLWEVDTGRTIGSSPIVGRSDRYSATVSPDGTFALLGEGNRLTFISETGKIDYLSIGGLDEQYGSIESLTISPNSALAATAHRRNDRESVAIWDLTEFHQA